MKKVLFATKNIGKLKELKAILDSSQYEILSLDDLNDNYVVIEDGFSFEENALIKAKYYFNKYHIATIADDSGISIDYLNGNPSIHSARFLGGKDYDYINNFIIDLMDGIKSRDAYYDCSIAYIYNDDIALFNGRLKGSIAFKQMGKNGFGYDPLFYLEKYQKTLAELDADIKNKLSHRYIALSKLRDYLEK